MWNTDKSWAQGRDMKVESVKLQPRINRGQLLSFMLNFEHRQVDMKWPWKSMPGFGILHFLSENVIMEMRSSMALVERTLGTHFNNNAIRRCMSFLHGPGGGETARCIWTSQAAGDFSQAVKDCFWFHYLWATTLVIREISSKWTLHIKSMLQLW